MNKSDKIVITGGAGLVGQNLIVRLKQRGFTHLVAIDKHPTRPRNTCSRSQNSHQAQLLSSHCLTSTSTRTGRRMPFCC